jgi:mannose-6-phosphate isomerase-like protein (cupin superfamily)
MDSERLDRAALVGPADGTAVWFLNNLTIIRATAEMTGGAYGLFESRVPPGFSPPLHVHHREDEAFWILEGELDVCCGDRQWRAGAGAYVFLPRGVPHSYVVNGSAPARMLTLVSPGGGEAFFIDAGRPAEWRDLPPPAPIDILRLRAAADKHAIDLVGPSMRSPGRDTRDAELLKPEF